MLLNATNNRFLSALQFRDFRILWIGSIAAGAAAWALIVARGWLVWDMSHSSLDVAIVTFLAMIPRVIIPPFSGYLADRFERRKVMAGLFSLNLGHNLILAVLIFAGDIQMWHLMAMAFIDGSARSAQMPVGQALVPNLVPRDRLLNAVALNQATMHGSRLIGPLAILPLLILGIEWAFLLCSGFYLISLIQSLRIRSASTGNMDRERGFFSNLVEGVPYVYKDARLRLIVLMAFLHCGFTMSFESILPVLSVKKFGAVEGSDFSLMMMSIGAGALISVIALSGVRQESTKGRMFLYLGLLSGVAPIILALSINMPMAIGAAILMGAAQAGFMTLTHTMIQLVTEDNVRGRVGAVYSVHIGGIMASMNLANGALAEISFLEFSFWNELRNVMPADTMLTVGGLLFVFAVFASWSFQTLRTIYQTGIPIARVAEAD
ncbi:MAG: hypothetical protein CL698_04800 [Chloroflexi bacterium]|nr:hypothetical protein [Chloroflexota bacterium]